MKAHVDHPIDIEWIEEFIIQRHLDYGEKSLLERAIEVREYQKGEVLISQGDVAQGLFFLKRGAVSMHVKGLADSVCVGRLEEGSQLGDMAIFDGIRASATVLADEDCDVYFLPRNTVIHLMTFRRDLSRDIMMKTIRQLSGALRHMNQFNAQAHQYIQEKAA